jgi:hypothetical protein
MIVVIVRADPHGIDFELRDNFVGHKAQLLRGQKTTRDVGLIAHYEQLEASRLQAPDRPLNSGLKCELGNMPWAPGLSIAKNELINHAIAIKEYSTAALHGVATASRMRPDGL